MNIELFKADLLEVLKKHQETMAAFVFAVSYLSESGDILSHGTTMVPVPPRDHEEEILRDKCAEDVCDLTVTLTQNIYLGR